MEAGLMTCAMPHMQHNTTTTQAPYKQLIQDINNYKPIKQNYLTLPMD